jgi:hypothetical protein
MGLDMYLYRRNYVSENYETKKSQIELKINKPEKDDIFPITDTIKTERVKYITEEIGYWRKFNALHQWFVENVQGGESILYQKKILKICLIY